MSAWANPQAARSQLSRKRWPKVAQVIGMVVSSRMRTRWGTFLRQRTARRFLSSTLRPRKAQAISKSAEMVAAPLAPPRKGVISTPSNALTVGFSPAAKFPLREKMERKRSGFRVDGMGSFFQCPTESWEATNSSAQAQQTRSNERYGEMPYQRGNVG